MLQQRLVILLVVVLIVMQFIPKETFFTPDYLNHKSKSFDAEIQVYQACGDRCALLLGQPTKSFDSERQNIELGKTIKYY
jgi:hypothetical protein